MATTSSSSSKSVLTNSNKHHNDSSNSLNSVNETSSSLSTNPRKNHRNHQEQNSSIAIRTPPPQSPPPQPPQTNIKPDRRKDIKITNCQERDGVWTATGQFGRESRHSKRTDISYDKKKFRFIQKDEQGKKHVFEIPITDLEGKKKKRLNFSIQFFSLGSRTQATNGTNASSSLDTISGAPPAQAIVYQKLACLLLDTINEAVQSTKDRKARSSFKMVRGTENDTKDFADLYDMNEKEILGMGRFGMVFGGTMRRNGVRVAIKKIQMTQCTQKDRENIEQEAAYLFQLNHPGLFNE